MKSSPKFSILIAFVCCLSWSCNSNPTTNPPTETVQDSQATEIPAEKPASHEDIMKTRLEAWNAAHASEDAAAIAKLYADKVNFYQSKSTRAAVEKSKASYFSKHPDFQQEIVEGSIIVDRDRVDFTKRVTVGGKAQEYPSYLQFIKRNGEWLVVTEGDKITDANLARKESAATAERVEGDFNGDGKKESMWLVPPRFGPEESMECIGDCDCEIRFSDPKIPTLKMSNCIGGTPVNETDLNGDGADEIGLLPWWWTSCWRGYFVSSFRNGSWINAVDPISTHCMLWEEGVDVIAVDPDKPGNVIVHYSEFDDDGIYTKSGSMAVRK
jgi:ketosteroid isomerase-like protein